MRASLLHPLSEPRHRRRHRRGAPTSEPAPQGVTASTSTGPQVLAPASPDCATPASPGCDPDVKRVREAGGPIDRASYACGCGYLFSASVSTTVACPHCGSNQAW
jgi:hypothetical protein